MVFRKRLGKILSATLITGSLVLAGASSTALASDRSG